jgi:hypothetical protein
MPLSLSEIEKGATVCEYWELNSQGVPIKPKNPARLGLIVKVVYNDGTSSGTERASGSDVKEIWVRFEEAGKMERVSNQSLVLHRRADQTTQYQLRKEANNGLVQDARSKTVKEDLMDLNDAEPISPFIDR